MKRPASIAIGGLAAGVIVLGLVYAGLFGSTAKSYVFEEQPGPVEVSSDGQSVRAKLSEVVPCQEIDPGSGCAGGPLYPLRTRRRLRIRPGARLEVDAGARAGQVSAWLGRYSSRTNYPRGNYRGTYHDKGDFVRLAQIGPSEGHSRRWMFRVPRRLGQPEQLNVGVSYANATREYGNFELSVVR